MNRSRDFDALSEAQVAAGRTAPRGVTGDARFRPRTPKPMSALLDAIQHVAEAATGERSFLHLHNPQTRADPADAVSGSPPSMAGVRRITHAG